MALTLRSLAARLLTVLAVCAQLLVPVGLSAAHARGLDGSGLLCAKGGAPLSAEARAAALDLARLLGADDPAQTQASGHCQHCTAVHALLLPQPPRLAAPALFVADTVLPLRAPHIVPKAHSPALGSRGPPSHI